MNNQNQPTQYDINIENTRPQNLQNGFNINQNPYINQGLNPLQNPQQGNTPKSTFSNGDFIKGALIGPGVHASHGMERTHYSAFENTLKLLISYITLK